MKPRKNMQGSFPPKTKQKLCSVHTAILTGIAVFFYSTPFYFFAFQFPNFNINSDKKALAARQAPFLFVGKWKIPLLYRARAPPTI